MAWPARVDPTTMNSWLDRRGCPEPARRSFDRPHPSGSNSDPYNGLCASGVSGRLVGPAAFKAVEGSLTRLLVGSIPIHSRNVVLV